MVDSELVPYIFGGLLVFAVLLLFVVIASRREKLRVAFLNAVAGKLGLTSKDRDKSVLPKPVGQFPLLLQGGSRKIVNVMHGEINGVGTTVFDSRYKRGRGKESAEVMQTVVAFESKDLALPAFCVHPVDVEYKFPERLGLKPVEIAREHPEMGKSYRLLAKDGDQAKKILTEEVVARFSRARGLAVEAEGTLLVFYRPDQLRRPEDLGAFLSNGFKILGEFEDAFYWAGDSEEEPEEAPGTGGSKMPESSKGNLQGAGQGE